MIEDEWKVIPDTANLYEVNNRGMFRRVFFKKDGSVRTKRELHPNVYKGAIRAYIKRNGKLAYYSVNRLVAEAFMGFNPYNQKYVVKHKDGNIRNNYVSNLVIEKKIIPHVA